MRYDSVRYRPFLDETGNMSFHTTWWKNVTSLGLSSREHLAYMWLMMDTSKCKDPEIIRKLRRNFCGSRTTEWRIKKALKERGLL